MGSHTASTKFFDSESHRIFPLTFPTLFTDKHFLLIKNPHLEDRLERIVYFTTFFTPTFHPSLSKIAHFHKITLFYPFILNDSLEEVFLFIPKTCQLQHSKTPIKPYNFHH